MADKTYIKSFAKEITGEYGSFMSVSIDVNDLAKYQNNVGWVNIKMVKRKSPGEKGQTHYVVLNEWKKPDSPQKIEQIEQKEYKTGYQKAKEEQDAIRIEDIPF